MDNNPNCTVVISCELVFNENGYDLEFDYCIPEVPPLIPQPNNLIVKEQTT